MSDRAEEIAREIVPVVQNTSMENLVFAPMRAAIASALRAERERCENEKWLRLAGAEARVKALEAALRRVLGWAEAVAGDNRFVAEAQEEIASVEAARAALGMEERT